MVSASRRLVFRAGLPLAGGARTRLARSGGRPRPRLRLQDIQAKQRRGRVATSSCTAPVAPAEVARALVLETRAVFTMRIELAPSKQYRCATHRGAAVGDRSERKARANSGFMSPAFRGRSGEGRLPFSRIGGPLPVGPHFFRWDAQRHGGGRRGGQSCAGSARARQPPLRSLFHRDVIDLVLQNRTRNDLNP